MSRPNLFKEERKVADIHLMITETTENKINKLCKVLKMKRSDWLRSIIDQELGEAQCSGLIR